ncbi:MAG: hypothetical protein N2D54_00795, partial [Chloroflexota bacterium]
VVTPEELAPLAKLQTKSLVLQGANPTIGQNLREMFNEFNLESLETGPLKSNASYKPSKVNWEMEWKVIQSDLANLLSKDKLTRYKEIDWEAWQNGQRELFIPTYYAFGLKPQTETFT